MQSCFECVYSRLKFFLKEEEISSIENYVEISFDRARVHYQRTRVEDDEI